MAFFKKKEAKKVAKEKTAKVKDDKKKAQDSQYIPDVKAVKTNDDFPYIIELYDVWGTTCKRTMRFAAKRWVDGKNEYLVNDKVSFKEPFPEDSLEYRQYKLVELKAKIDSTDKKLIRAIKDKSASIEKDLREELRLYSSWKRSLELSGRGAYMTFDSDEAGGKPLFQFDRKGNFKLPVFKNIDLSLMYIPSEVNIAEAGDLLKENELKNGPDDGGIKLINLAITILLVISLCVSMYYNYKTAQLPSDIANTFTAIMDKLATVTTNLDSASNNLMNVSEYVEVDLPPTKEVPIDNLN